MRRILFFLGWGLTLIGAVATTAIVSWVSPKWGLPVVAIPAVIAFFVFVLWKAPKWQVRSLQELQPKELFELENEARKTMAQILGGGLLLAGLYFTAQTLRINSETLQVNQDRQITERFTRAVEQLGHDKLQIRLGGIYALQRIAYDSQRDYGPTMEILAAYVRANAAWHGDKAPKGKQFRANPPADIQASLTVIAGHVPWARFLLRSVDLSRTDLRQVELYYGQLQHVNLNDAHLEKANLSGTDLSLARVMRAVLIEAYLSDVNLSKAMLQEANLSKTHLEKATLEGALMYGANLGGANLQNANLRSADLTSANLRTANLTGADLRGADLSAANLQGANLTKADVRGTSLLSVSGITREQLEAAITDEKTVLPPYLQKD